jgi:hypothetical protein
MSSTDYGFYWNTGQPTRRMHSKSNILALSAAFHNLASPKRVQPKKTPRESFCYFDSPEVPLARTSSSKSSRRGVVGLSPQFDSENFLQYKVLRFRRKGHCSSPQLACISSGFLSGNSLVVKGDALIHGPRLVARPVGSEWRTRRPYEMDIQFNQLREK